MKYQTLLTTVIVAASCALASTALADKLSIEAFVPPDDVDEFIGAAPYFGEMEVSELAALVVNQANEDLKANSYEPPLEEGDAGIGAAPF